MDNKYLFLSDDDLSKVNGGVKENDDAQGEKHCPECHVFWIRMIPVIIAQSVGMILTGI